MKKIAIILSSVSLFVFPVVAFAETRVTSIQGALGLIRSLMGIAVPLLIAAAVVVFLYGVLKFITSSGDAEKRKESQGVMIWGIIGIAVMVSVWGLVRILTGTVNPENTVPEINRMLP